MPTTNHATEVSEFIDQLFSKEQKGYLYAPTKDADGDWQTHYFKWPQRRQEAIAHIVSSSEDFDVYLSPSLFKAPRATKQAWLGTHYVWIEFDGNAPETTPNGIPEPSVRIQSSEAAHEHWYWRLQSFNSSVEEVEGLAKALTYTLDADKSGWDCDQVLRAPGSLHQESRRRVKVLNKSDTEFNFGDFKGLVKLDDIESTAVVRDELPEVKTIVAKYKWDDDNFDLFSKEKQPVGSRSSAMTRLGFACIEMGMSNEECYAILYDADERWGKYKHRSPQDRHKRLVGLVSHCRGKKEFDAEIGLADRESFVSFKDFRTSDIQVKWLYEDLLTDRGLGIISAQPGVGKTTLSLRLGFNTVLGLDFFKYRNVGDPQKVGFLSLEMGSVELKVFFDTMMPSFTPSQLDTIDENFFVLPLGYSLSLAEKKYQQNILDEIDKNGIQFLIIDSLKAATALDEKKLDTFFNWINKEVRENRGVTVWIVHHNRKPPNETDASRKPKDLGDLYGDTFITAHPTAVLSLYRVSSTEIEVIPLKVRLADMGKPFVVRRTPHLSFEVKQLDTDSQEPTSDTEQKVEKKSNNGPDTLFG